MNKRAALAAALAAGLLGALRSDAAASCAGSATFNVSNTGGLQAAINTNIPAGPLSQDYCLQLLSGTFAENIFIGNRTAGPFRIIISSATGASVMITPISGTPAFDIEMDSVTVNGVTIRPVATGPTYGVSATTATAVVISSVVINEQGGFVWGNAAARISTNTVVTYSSFTASNVPALIVGGPQCAISFSTFVTAAAGFPAVNIVGASTVTISNSYLANSAGTGLSFATGSDFNQVLQSTVTGGNSASAVVFNTGTSTNTISQSYIFSSGSNAIVFNGNNSNTTLSLSTAIAGGAVGTALSISASSGTVVSQSYLRSSGGYALFMSGASQFGSITQSTMAITATAGGFDAVSITAGPSYNTFNQCNISAVATTSNGLSIFNGNHINVIASTITSQNTSATGGSVVCANLACAANTFNNDFVYNTNPSGLNGFLFDNLSNQNTLSQSTITAVAGNALKFNNSSTNTVTQTYMTTTGGPGIAALAMIGASSNVVSNSSMTNVGAGVGSAALFNGSSNNAITQSFINGVPGDGLTMTGGASFNVVSFSTMQAGANVNFALNMNGGAFGNQVQNSFLTNAFGVAAIIQGNLTSQNTVAGSTMVANSGSIALKLVNTSTNTISIGQISALNAGQGVVLSGASSNTLSGLSISGAVNNPVVQVTGNSANNAITASFVSNTLNGLGNAGLQIDGGSSLNTVSFSTVTGFQGSACVEGAFMISGASNNTLFNDYIGDAQGNALFVTGAAGNQVSFSTMSASGVASCGAGNGVYIGGGGSANLNTFSNSFFYGTAGSTAFYFDFGATNNTVSLSTLIATASGGNAVSYVNVGTNETVTQSYLFGGNPANQAVNMGCQGSGNTLSLSTIVYSGANAAVNTADSNTTISNDLIVNNGAGPGVTLGVCGPVNAGNSTIFGSTITAGSVGIQITGIANVAVNGSVVQASTAVLVVGSTNTFVTGNTLKAQIGGNGDDLAIVGGGNTVTIGSNTYNGPSPTNYAVLDNNVGPVVVTGYQVVNGTFAVIGAAVNDGPYTHTMRGDLKIAGAGSSYNANLTSLSMDGVTNNYRNQTFTYPSAATVGSVNVTGSSVTFLSGGFTLTIGTLTDFIAAASTLTFGAGSTFNINNLQIHGAAPGMAKLVSSSPGTPWKLNVFTSTVTGSFVQDSNAGSLNTVLANDGTVVDNGNNINWGFQPQLVVVLPGQAYTSGVGLLGAPSPQSAGVAFNVAVKAVSYSSTTVPSAAMSVTLAGTDAFQNPPNASAALTLPLVNGATTFSNITVQDAEGPASVSSYTARGAPAITSYLDQLPALPNVWTALQVVIPSEQPNPGSTSNNGKLNLPDVQIASRPIPSIQVRAVDAFNNLVPGAAGNVAIIGTTSSTATWQSAAQPLVGGTTIFTSTFTFFSTGTFTLTVAKVGGGVPNALSGPITVAFVSLASPTVHLNIDQSTATGIGGQLTGYAFDASAINKVFVAVSTIGAGGTRGYFTFTSPGSFSSPTAILTTATLQGQGAYVNWSAPVPDATLADKTSYYVEMRGVDANNDVGVFFGSFLYEPSLLAVPPGGEGTAFVVPSISSGCEPVVSTVTFTVGPSGLQPGGEVIVQLPPGWTGPTQAQLGATNSPTAGKGYFASSNGASLAAASIQCSAGAAAQAGASSCSVTVFSGQPAFNPGDTIVITIPALPPVGPGGRGAQAFGVQSQSAANGSLKAIAAVPSLTLNQGTTAYFSFVDPSPLTLGPLQTSATMQLEMVDLCGNLVSTNVIVTATMTAYGGSQFGVGVDTNAVFFATSAAGGVIVSSVTFWPFNPYSNQFYYETSTSGVTFETIEATGQARGLFTPSFAQADRIVSILVSSFSFSGVSIDSGSVNPLQKVTTITYTGAPSPAFIRFTPSAGGVGWSVTISSDPVAFAAPVFTAYGLTAANQPQNVAWNGVDTLASPAQFVPASTYYVLLRGANGAVQDASLRVSIPQSPYIAGNLGAKGAGAIVSVSGPGAGFGNQGVATSTGYFQVFGLVDQQYYAVQAATSIVVGGQSVTISTGIMGVQALAAGDLIPGALSFPATAFLQASVTLPQPAPQEMTGVVKIYSSSGVPAALGNLHFYAGSGTSDNGAQAFGQSASTWTTMLVTPDTYTVQVTLPDVRLSTQLAGVLVNPFATIQLPIVFAKKANVFGFVTIPSTTSFGAAISISGQVVGVSSPSIFGSAFVQPFSAGMNYSSAPYALYGLDPGTWTITARSDLFLSSAVAVFISSNADLGDSTYQTPGFAFNLSSGGVIAGTVTVNGDTTQASQCITSVNGICPAGFFEVAVQAYNRQTFQTAILPLRLSKSATQTSSTFTISGLTSGQYIVQTALDGWLLSPAGGQLVVVSSPAVATSSLTLNTGSTPIQFAIQLPAPPGGGCHPAADAHNVGLWGPIYFGAGGRDIGWPDVVQSEVANSTVSIFCSSMTVVIPPQNNGAETVTVTYNPTGASARRVLTPVIGAATTLNFDLSQPTVTVRGKVTFSGSVQLSFSTYSVTVSTLGGLLQYAPTNYFCLITATNTIPVSTMHLELIPLDPHGDGTVPPLRDYGFAGGSLNGCNPEAAFGGNWGLMGYVAQMQSDGSFSFGGVSAGVYRLRNYANLDLNPARGAEIGFFETNIAVTTNTTNLLVPISQGFAVSGLITLPPGLTASRIIQLSLIDGHGNPVAQLPVQFNGANAAPYTFTNVANGQYSINVLDYGLPYTYSARPVEIQVLGAALSNQNIQLQQAGTIKANLAIQQTLSDGSKQFIAITNANKDLLGGGLLVDAIASPWVQGGYFRANSVNCSSPLECFSATPGPLNLDANTSEMQIIGVLPGTYNIEFNVPAGVSAGATGGINLVSTVKSGVTVGPGQTVDLGVVGLSGGVTLSGRVTDVATSTPLVGVRMLARPSSTQSGQTSARSGFQLAFTDQNGNYAFTALDPALRYYDVLAANRDALRQGDVLAPYEQQVAPSVDLQSTSTLNFALNPAPYSVSGQVVGRPGDQLLSGIGQSQGGVPGATILMQKVGALPTANPVADIVFQTDAQGNFTVPALAPGKYALFAAALNYATYATAVTIVNSSVTVGVLQLGQGATLSGAIRKADGTAPSEDEIQTVVGAATDLGDYFFGLVNRDPRTRGITGYSLSGFQPGVHYRVIFVSVDHELAVPPEVYDVVFASSAEARGLDVTFTPKKPFVTAKASRDPSGAIKVRLHASQPFRERLLSDDNLSVMLTTVSAQGFISTVTLSVDRRELTAFYNPGVSESSFTLQLQAYSGVKDPNSADPINSEFVIFSTPTFFIGTDGASSLNVNNVEGGGVVMDGDQARITLPKGAFSVDASSGVQVVFQKSIDVLAGAKLAAQGTPTVEANIRALRYSAAAYPSSLFQAMAALPSGVSPFSGFYNVLLPLGIRTALAKPVQMTISYSTSTTVDPSNLNLYWFNAAANAYVLQQDVTGAAPIIDRVNHTITINVNHFSTFVLFNTGVNVITGATFGGTEITVYNFPNPFDLSTKQVSTIHGGGAPSVRGTMISIGLPLGASGQGTLKIFNVAGERVRSIDLGSVIGGNYYYQPWDGRNDSGRDVASGVYIGEIKAGGKSKFFKMALIK